MSITSRVFALSITALSVTGCITTPIALIAPTGLALMKSEMADQMGVSISVDDLLRQARGEARSSQTISVPPSKAGQDASNGAATTGAVSVADMLAKARNAHPSENATGNAADGSIDLAALRSQVMERDLPAEREAVCQ